MSPRVPALGWRQVHWRRPITPDDVVQVLRLWAHDPHQAFVVLECHVAGGEVAYFLGASESSVDRYGHVVTSVMAGSQVTSADRPATPVRSAVAVRVRGSDRPLRRDQVEATVRAVLAAAVGQRHRVVVQVVLGDRRAATTPRQASTQSVDAELRSARRQKLSEPAFGCVIRLGTSSPHRSVLAAVQQAVATLASANVRFRVVAERPSKLTDIQLPWWWPQYLNIEELAALTLWPVGDGELPGLGGLHPVPLPPPAVMPLAPEYVIAAATTPGISRVIGMDTTGSLRHSLVLGPPGVGKSTLLLNLLLQDVASGKGAVLVEPKGDVVDDFLARLPAHRRDDVVILDPTDAMPVGLNPLTGGSPDVRAEGVLEVFTALFGDAIGPRSRDVLHNALLVLCRRGDASLVMLPLLLTNPGFRRSVTQQAIRDDPLALGQFWNWYEAISEAERAAVIAPVMNKLRVFTINQQLRAVVGQRQPRFSVEQVFTENKILLVPLRSGILGQHAARLLGSLLVAELWQAVLGRVAVPEAKRSPVVITIDELHQYVHHGDLGEMLALARGYGVGYRMATQTLNQVPNRLRADLVGNVRSRVVFQTNHRDAAELAKGHPEIAPEDFTALGPYEVYASLMVGNAATPYASGRTLPAPPGITSGREIRQASRYRYGQPLADIESDLLALIDPPLGEGSQVVSGRKRRQT